MWFKLLHFEPNSSLFGRINGFLWKVTDKSSVLHYKHREHQPSQLWIYHNSIKGCDKRNPLYSLQISWPPCLYFIKKSAIIYQPNHQSSQFIYLEKLIIVLLLSSLCLLPNKEYFPYTKWDWWKNKNIYLGLVYICTYILDHVTVKPDLLK